MHFKASEFHSTVADKAHPQVSQQVSSQAHPLAGFVALSRFALADGEDASGTSHVDRVHEAFRARPHLVDSAHGFRKLDVLRPIESPNEIWLVTYWDDEQSYRIWHKSHEYHESHKGIPKGIRLIPKTTKIEFFEHIAS